MLLQVVHEVASPHLPRRDSSTVRMGGGDEIGCHALFWVEKMSLWTGGKLEIPPHFLPWKSWWLDISPKEIIQIFTDRYRFFVPRVCASCFFLLVRGRSDFCLEFFKMELFQQPKNWVSFGMQFDTANHIIGVLKGWILQNRRGFVEGWLDNAWITGWWFQRFFIFIPNWGRFSNLTSIFLKWAETTNLIMFLGLLDHQMICLKKNAWTPDPRLGLRWPGTLSTSK